MAQTMEVYDQQTGQWITVTVPDNQGQAPPPERGAAQFIYDEDGTPIPYYPGSEY